MGKPPKDYRLGCIAVTAGALVFWIPVAIALYFWMTRHG